MFIIICIIGAIVYIALNKNNIRPYQLYKRKQVQQVPIASNSTSRFTDTAFELHKMATNNIYPNLPSTSSVPV